VERRALEDHIGQAGISDSARQQDRADERGEDQMRIVVAHLRKTG
jgi:hypothetical protein